MENYSKSSPVTILRAREEDLPIIQQFSCELLSYERSIRKSGLDPKWPFSESGREAYLTSIMSNYAIIARIGGEPVGYLIGHVDSLTDDAESIKIARLQNLYVVEKARNLGIATKMFTGFRSYCFSQGANRLDVSVLTNNAIAVCFYEKIGLKTRSVNMSMEI